jgi:hypothetical protein
MDVDQDRTGLLSDRWRPYFFGCLVGLSVAVVMLQVWRHWDLVAEAQSVQLMPAGRIVP